MCNLIFTLGTPGDHPNLLRQQRRWGKSGGIGVSKDVRGGFAGGTSLGVVLVMVFDVFESLRGLERIAGESKLYLNRDVWAQGLDVGHIN